MGLSENTPGEFDLIEWIRNQTAPGIAKLGIGDDCAIVGIERDSDLLITTDMLMDGRHFRLEQDGARAVGYKAAAVNVSDIAAMAGIPSAAVVAVALPRGSAADIAKRLYAGIRELLDRFDVALIGGDTNAWDGPLVISVTLLGMATARGAVLRSGAKPGDAIMVTGPLGGSLHAGRHLRPEPRVAEALAIHEAVGIHAMIDLSDGLASDLAHILHESGGLGAVLDEAAIPIHDDAAVLARVDGTSALDHALSDGEDFELCLTVAEGELARLLAAPPYPARLYPIGRVTAAPGFWLRDSGGHERAIERSGFDHFRA